MRKGSYFRANERMYLRTIGRRFTQMIAYFLIMNSKRCIINYHVSCRINRLLIFYLIFKQARPTPRQNVYACARLSISGQFFSHSFQSDHSPRTHSRPQSPSFLGHVVGKRGVGYTGYTGWLQIKPSGSGDENGARSASFCVQLVV